MSELESYVTSLGLEDALPILHENGIEIIHDLQDFTFDDLVDLGVAAPTAQQLIGAVASDYGLAASGYTTAPLSMPTAARMPGSMR